MNDDTSFTKLELKELNFLKSQIQWGYFTEPNMAQKFMNLAEELSHV